jgi:3-deoxy-manno-octulosonate cytidylyltransferase (CMP-KDO synthetase)
MKIIGVIPARYKSSRFPGKPLAVICGKPMIWYVFNQVKKVPEFSDVYVATDDERIEAACGQLGIPVIMTSDQHPTGTDRVAEVAEKIPADLYVNIQGDEPLIEPETIRQAIFPYLNGETPPVVNLMTTITDPVDAINPTVPKVIVGSNGRGLYLTRSMCPYPKGSIDYYFYKQVCAYAFTPEALQFFKSTQRGKIERIEDIEILRFIENGCFVKFVEVKSNTVAVDTEKDLERVIEIVRTREEII